MNAVDDRGIVDQSALRMREATVSAGVWLSYVVCSSAGVYIVLTWQRPHRVLISMMFGAGLLGAAIVARLPCEQIVRSRYREAFFFTWSALDLALIVVATVADGGTHSPLALIFFIPVVFAAMSYPLVSVAAVAGLSVAAYLVLAVTLGGAPWSYQALFAVMLSCTGAMSAWQARNHDRQRLALMEVSRADPLTGCLNRRGFEELAIAEIASTSRRAHQGSVLLLDVDHFKEVNDRYGHAAGDELLRWVVATLRCSLRPTDAIGRLGGDEFAVLFADIEPAEAVRNAGRMGEALAERVPCSIGVASFPTDGLELEELMRAADGRLYASRDGRPEPGRTSADERLSWAATLAHAVDMRMNAGHEHSRAVAELAVSIAAALGWRGDMLAMLRIAAMLHDVGNVAVPDRILSKPGRLTSEEFEAVKAHSVAGAELVASVEGLATVVPWIRHCHERVDGTGYPDRLQGEAIPLASRIMLVADAFDAITNARPYREAASIEQACEELRRGAGTQFDSGCVAVLLQLVRARHAPGARSSAGPLQPRSTA